MLKFIRNCDGFIGLTLSQLGLFIAVAVLLAAVFNFVFLNDWGHEAEMENIAEGLSSHVDGMDTYFFENKSCYFFPDKDFDYSVVMSTEYIVIDSDSGWFNDEEIRVTERLVTNVLPRDNRFRWKTGEELHGYLESKYGYQGTFEEPIETVWWPISDTILEVQTHISREKTITEEFLAEDPLEFDQDKAVFVEKVYVYYDDNWDGSWDSENDSREEILLLYQE